jgi:FKBP-type peptidyl-prolyl cis-trans isomerase FkpA
MKTYFSILVFSITLIFSACGSGKDDSARKYRKPPMSQKQLDSLIIEAEKAYNKMEEDNIKSYISSHQYEMQRTQSGYWYMITKPNPKGKVIADGTYVRYSRKISLCDGTECYSDTNLIKVSQGQEITGMHDALKRMKSGEKGVFIFPSYLAHGLMGDAYKIPPKSELVYEVEIIEAK